MSKGTPDDGWVTWAWAIVLAAACGGSVVESAGGAGEGGRSGGGAVGASGAR